MTGKWLRRMDTDAPRKHSRCTFLLDDGYALDYVDSRKFGRLQLKWIHASSQDAVMTRTGPDALHVCQHPRALAEIYSRTRQPIKVGLMDQKRVAGVGNIYAAEALHMAGIHPGAPANSLDETQWTELGRQIVRVMEDSLARETGSEIDYLSFGGQNPFMVYGRAGKPCSGCGTHIQRIVQAGRSTFLCIHCQPSS
jgi:formamidopyrimidine-DNA glycosylase